MKVCYLILVYNELEYTIKTFESIKAQIQKKYKFDIICIDNNSREDISTQLKDYCEKNAIRYIFHNENDGYAGGNNYGWSIVKEEEYDYVFIANNDIELLHEAITEKILDVLESDKKIALVGTNLLDKNNTPIKYSRFHKRIQSIEKINNYKSEDFLTVPSVIGCFFCIRVLYAPLELFDASFFMYSEEQNLEYYLMMAGYFVGILRDEKYLVKHYGGFFDFKTASNWKIYLNIRNSILTFRNFSKKNRKIYMILYFFFIIRLFVRVPKSIVFKAFIRGCSLLDKPNSEIYADAKRFL